MRRFVVSLLLRAICLSSLTAFAAHAEPVDAPAIPMCSDAGIDRPSPANVHTATAEDYPPLSVVLFEEGRVELDFIVKEDGSVGGPKIAQSSGFPRLDEAAATIVVPRWRYNPAMKNGKPIACRLHAIVAWKIGGSETGIAHNQVLTVMHLGPAYYTADMLARREEGAVVVVVFVGADGKVLHAVVSPSSGFPDIDAASLKMVQNGWQFKPAEISGRPVPTAIGIAFVWSLTPSPDATSVPPAPIPK
jgi:TonB family protein